MRNSTILAAALLLGACGPTGKSSTPPNVATNEAPGLTEPSDKDGHTGDEGGTTAGPTGPTGEGRGTSDTGAPASGDGEGGGSTSGGGSGQVQAGTLTAGVWDDNLNFDFYLAYLAASETAQLAGVPSVARADRLTVHVNGAGGLPLPGAEVVLRQGGRLLARTLSGADGRALFFPIHDGATAGEPLEIAASSGAGQGAATAVAGTAGSIAIALDAQAAVGALDVAFVVDATGSMGDEMQYLKVEFDAIATAVLAAHPGLAVRWGLIVYRDQGDEYEVRSFPFTSDAAEFRTHLGEQRANGGGDYPEASERALAQAAAFAWSDGATARVAFHVADAPQHLGREGELVAAIDALRTRGVHVYPVASSGVDERTEYSMRTAAQTTGGRYIFLTDDSGVGGPHKEPTIPCYFVTKLDKAVLRVVDTEITGIRRDPAADEILRTGGDPQNGACTLSGGQTVQVF